MYSCVCVCVHLFGCSLENPLLTCRVSWGYFRPSVSGYRPADVKVWLEERRCRAAVPTRPQLLDTQRVLTSVVRQMCFDRWAKPLGAITDDKADYLITVNVWFCVTLREQSGGASVKQRGRWAASTHLLIRGGVCCRGPSLSRWLTTSGVQEWS